MKKVIGAFSLLLVTTFASAQINKGQFLVGGNASFTSSKYSEAEGSATSFSLNPNFGYFFINNLAGGVKVSFSSLKEEGDDAFTSFSAAPFVRYYFLPATQKVNVFADASYGFGSAGEEEKVSFNQFSIMAGPAIFLTPNTALEFGVGYLSQGGDAFGDGRFNTIGVNVGFQIHLGAGKK